MFTHNTAMWHFPALISGPTEQRTTGTTHGGEWYSSSHNPNKARKLQCSDTIKTATGALTTEAVSIPIWPVSGYGAHLLGVNFRTGSSCVACVVCCLLHLCLLGRHSKTPPTLKHVTRVPTPTTDDLQQATFTGICSIYS